MLRRIKTDKDGRLDSPLQVLKWDKELQQIVIVKKYGKIFQFIEEGEDEGILWFVTADACRHWTIYDVRSGYECTWRPSLAKSRALMTDPDFRKKVNEARERRYASDMYQVLIPYFNNQEAEIRRYIK